MYITVQIYVDAVVYFLVCVYSMPVEGVKIHIAQVHAVWKTVRAVKRAGAITIREPRR